MISCRHCEGDATDHDVDEGDSFKCESCGILGTVYQTDGDNGAGEAVAYLAFDRDVGEECSWDECEECMR